MANYQTILYVREAVQLEVPDTPSSIPPSISIDEDDFPVYRDPNGLYVLVNTVNGKSRANEGQWVVLMSPGVPAIPATPEVKATGTITINDVAEGNGLVGFSYNGVSYAINPEPGASPEDTALALAGTINAQYGLLANAANNIISVTSQITGAAGNSPLIDISTDGTQVSIPVGMTGGVTFIPEVPEILPVFEIFNDGDFQEIYEPEII